MGYFDDKSRIYNIIAQAEVQVGMRLTVGAGEMLAIPIMERAVMAEQGAGSVVDWSSVETSIFRIVGNAKRGLRGDEETNGRLNAKSIIRAFSEEFCNIPPFC
jgi:hypothetical protein